MQLRINAFGFNAQVASGFQTFGITLQVDFVPSILCGEVQEISVLVGNTERCEFDQTKPRPGKVDPHTTNLCVCW